MVGFSSRGIAPDISATGPEAGSASVGGALSAGWVILIGTIVSDAGVGSDMMVAGIKRWPSGTRVEVTSYYLVCVRDISLETQ